MKKILYTLVSLLTVVSNVNAMSYSQARDEALFLTDKMAYELNLNERQYEAAYEINLDYLMGVNTADDLYTEIWHHRNADLRYILLDWQYEAFCAASYFFRPLYWSAGLWHFAIYGHYPHRDRFFFHRPVCYASYRGGHTWRSNGGASWYGPRVEHYRGPAAHVGMRDNVRRVARPAGAVRHMEPAPKGRPVATPQRPEPVSRRPVADNRRTDNGFRGGSSDTGNRGGNHVGSSWGGRQSSTRVTVDRNRGGGTSAREGRTGVTRGSAGGGMSHGVSQGASHGMSHSASHGGGRR